MSGLVQAAFDAGAPYAALVLIALAAIQVGRLAVRLVVGLVALIRAERSDIPAVVRALAAWDRRSSRR
ncbi:hypothetical protein GCM10023224_15500 [Streptomonospora halophila]|uniref:Mechanosensitive ion channel family protein n=1 Tax=Streptomonospora halophila TaxID=427369 RepID=A0ABP9GHL8_9ACTN